MHPTDTLLSLSHARIARAAAAGPQHATQPTAQTDQQHIARRQSPRTHIVEALADEWARRQNGTILRLKAINEAHAALARDIAAL